MSHVNNNKDNDNHNAPIWTRFKKNLEIKGVKLEFILEIHSLMLYMSKVENPCENGLTNKIQIEDKPF